MPDGIALVKNDAAQANHTDGHSAFGREHDFREHLKLGLSRAGMLKFLAEDLRLVKKDFACPAWTGYNRKQDELLDHSKQVCWKTVSEIRSYQDSMGQIRG